MQEILAEDVRCLPIIAHDERIEMKKSEKMIKLLRDKGIELPEDARIQRTYAGHEQKSAGALCWYVLSETGIIYPSIGGAEPITDLLKCPNLIIGKCDERPHRDIEVSCGCKGFGCEGIKK